MNMAVLQYVEAIAVILAALAVAAFSIRGFLLAGRLTRLADEFSRALDEEVKRTLEEWDETARRTRESLGKLDAAVIPFGHTVRRIEKWMATIATEALVANALSPALSKVGGWLSGLRKGIGGVLRHE